VNKTGYSTQQQATFLPRYTHNNTNLGKYCNVTHPVSVVMRWLKHR